MRTLARICASAALCTPALAYAQNVLLGGQIKLGLDATSVNGATNPGGTASHVFRESNQTSFFFLDGKEDLGNGTKALYHLEWDFSADTGAQGAGRAFYVGVDSVTFGRLQFGRQTVYFSHHWFITDTHGAFDAAPSAANSLNVIGSINGANFAGNYLNNTVRYETPVFRGFAAMASYSFDAEQPGAGRNHTWYLSPSYTNGPLSIGFYHMQRNSQGILPLQTVGSLDQMADKFAISYTYNGLRLGAVVDRNRVDDRATGSRQDRIAFSVPLSYATGPHLFSLTYGQALPVHQNGSTLADTGARMLSVSYQYSLSKRTWLDITAVELRNQPNGRYNFWLGGLNGSSPLPLQDAGAQVRMFYAGIKHQF